MEENSKQKSFETLDPSPAGLTIRDWFAAQALAGFSRAREAEMFNENTIRWYARVAYELADAMLEERTTAPRPKKDRAPLRPPESAPVVEARPPAPVVWPSLNINGH